MTSKWRCGGKENPKFGGWHFYEDQFRWENCLVLSCFLAYCSHFDYWFIPSSAKIGLDAFNLGYFMDDFNEFKIQGIPNILIIDCWKFEIYHVGVVDFFIQKS